MDKILEWSNVEKLTALGSDIKHKYICRINDIPIIILIEDKETYGVFEMTDVKLEPDKEHVFKNNITGTPIKDEDAKGFAFAMLAGFLLTMND